MNLAIIGYGKMGRLIEQLAPEYGFAVLSRLDSSNNTNAKGITAENFKGIDVAVDFSIASAVAQNIERLAELGINAVVGTTGWVQQLEQARVAVLKSKIGLVWSPNYSVGVNIFLQREFLFQTFTRATHVAISLVNKTSECARIL